MSKNLKEKPEPSKFKQVESKRLFNFDTHKWLGIPFNILFFAFSMILMQAVATLRIDELSISLENISQKGQGVRSAGLVARFLMMRKKSSSLKSQKDALQSEAQLMAILSGETFTKEKAADKYKWLKEPGRWIINLVNFIAGKDPLVDVSEDRGLKMLEMAYFYERKRQFNKSIPIYNAALKYYSGSSAERPYIFLHRGYGLALVGYSKKALKDFKRVSLEAPRSELAVTAQILSQFLEEARKKIKHLANKKDNVKKGVQLFNVMAYRRAIALFNKLEKKNKKQALYYYRGRSYEELGLTQKALADYRRVIKMNQNSTLAKFANRRRYILGAFYEDNKKLKEESKKLAAKTNDDQFTKKLDKIEKAADVKKVSKIKEDKVVKEVIAYVEEQNKPKEEVIENNVAENVEEQPKDELAELDNIFVPEEEEEEVVVPEKKVEVKPVEKIEEKPIVEEKPKPKPKPKPKKKRKPRITVKQLLNPELEPEKRRDLLKKKYKKVDVIFTTEGDILVGKIVKKRDNVWQIVTIYGGIKLLPEHIVMQRKELSKKALK